MENSDLNKLKKKYGEDFSKLCRELFPILLEREGLLTEIITKNFAESKFLYNDIVDNSLQNDFKNYIFSFTNQEVKTEISTEDPFNLMKKAGYTLYKCETNKDVESFRKYYKAGERICIFIDEERIKKILYFLQ